MPNYRSDTELYGYSSGFAFPLNTAPLAAAAASPSKALDERAVLVPNAGLVTRAKINLNSRKAVVFSLVVSSLIRKLTK